MGSGFNDTLMREVTAKLGKGGARKPTVHVGTTDTDLRTVTEDDLASGRVRIVLADEVLTPDSSRFWPADGFEPGRQQPSFDKQYVRDWLTSDASGWHKDSDTPPPALPADVVAGTRAKYVEAYERLTGESFR